MKTFTIAVEQAVLGLVAEPVEAGAARKSLTPLPRLMRIGGWAAVFVVAGLSLVPGGLRPHVMTADYTEHFLTYLVIGGLLALGYRRRVPVMLIGVALTGYSGALELGQLISPGRDANVADFVSSSAGAWCGISAAYAVQWLSDQLRRPASEADPG